MPRQNTIQLRKGTLSQWTANNSQVLASGEPAFEVDTLRLKIGDGTTAWSGLNYVGLAGTGASGYLPRFDSSQGVVNSLVYDNGTDVGIGTNSPSSQLHVVGSGLFASGLNLSNQTASTIASFDPSKNIISLSTATYPSLTELSYVKGTTSAIQTQINNKQNTLTNPVTGTGTNGRLSKWSSTSTLNDSILSEASTVINIAGSFNSTIDDTYLSFDANSRRIGMTKKGGFTGKFTYGSASSFAIAQSNSGTIEATNTFTDRLVIDSGGNVGIGTASPSDKLNVIGNISAGTLSTTQGKFIAYGSSSQPNLLFEGFDATGKARISTNSGANRQLKIENDGASNTLGVYIEGDVGIGTDTPTSKLHVAGDVLATGSFIGGSGTSSLPSFEFVNDPDTGLFSPSANTFGISTSGVERLRVDSAGNIGIGTTNPGYKLQVSGSFGATTKSFRIDHPSKPGFSLEYGSLESPYHGVRLTGRDKVIKGVGTVSLPDYLKDLIHDDDTLNIQITNIKHGKTIYIDKIDLQNDRFIVKVDRAKSLGELQFFWTLTGVRKDVDHLVVEKEN
jgi:hypothetical protein